MVQEVQYSIRFKHGIHTIFLLVDPLKTFSAVQEELLEVLAERYPDGLKSSLLPPKTTPLPADASLIAFALPKTPNDLANGWKPLQVEASDTLVSKSVKDNSTFAFDILPNADADATFHIEVPTFEEYAEPE